jgi:uncharacterized protein with HEPN domain
MFEKREMIDFLQDAFSAMEKAEGFVADMTYEHLGCEFRITSGS